ncbi:tail fiber protein [Xenorhabdus sp. 42]|uniref:phage tail protein n=1 Tax=Xenorhabdus szentirmaii TaxID=290112 RepID=UPI0019A7C07A|nr:phage tail protein [Xenorhabdus sp. 42]MBD2821619.1 tail fiber protein [Xenorhabdus sp. 42]
MQDKKLDASVSAESNLVIVTTPEYIKEAIKEHAASRNHPDATLQDKGFVVLSNDIGSDSETMAATPKAVKAVYDLANTANNKASDSVPIGRKVNGYSLSADLTLKAEDIGTYTKAETDSHISEVNSLATIANQNAINAKTNAESRLAKNQNGADITDKPTFVNNLGLTETVTRAKNAVQGTQYTDHLTAHNAAWIKIAEVTMKTSSSTPSTININIVGGSGYNVGYPGQCSIANIVLRTGNNDPHGINAVMYITNTGAPTGLATVNTSGDNYDIYVAFAPYSRGILLNAFASDGAIINNLSNLASSPTLPELASKGKVFSYQLQEVTS